MSKDTRLIDKINSQLERFVGDIASELSRPQMKFVHRALFGVQASRDVKLSEIVRSLDEEIPLIKTETRLSRNMKDAELGVYLWERLIAHACDKVDTETVLALDITDLEKRYAKKMDFLASVWDGMEKRRTRGYWVLEVAGANVDRDQLVPLYSELYSQEADDFNSENTQIIRTIDAVNRHVEGRGIWVIDRGGDRNVLLRQLIRKRLRFIIGVKARRTFILKGQGKIKGSDLASRISCSHAYTVEVDHQGYKEKLDVSIGVAKVRIPGVKGILSLVVVRRFGKDPMLLLTNVEKNPVALVDIYLTRWKIEESIRFLKREYHLEDVRVRNYYSLKNTVLLLLAVFYFRSVHLGRKLKLNILLKKIYEKAKRFFQIPAFSQYALADGIYRILFDTKWRYSPAKKTFAIEPKQILFSFAKT